MSEKIIKGKVALSTKPVTSTDLTWEADYDDLLAIDPALKAEIAAKGFEYRFIRAKKYVEDGAYHKMGYRPYKRDPVEKKDGHTFEFGADPEGYLRRGDLILAVKPKALVERDRAKIRARTEAYNNVVQRNKEAAEDLRRTVSDAGGTIGVSEGDDDDSDG